MNTNHPYTNQLIHESSPYLLEHAHNPVNWYPWGKEALDLAKQQNKPIIISIGYAACHWCHVMEHESFSNVQVANVMNDHFISIKIDREERPDLDQIYMDAAHLIHGTGGWPLNVIALPDGRPFFAGTYFQPQVWVSILNQTVEIYRTRYHDVVAQADTISNAVDQMDYRLIQLNNQPDDQLMLQIWSEYHKTIDEDLGGFNGAPKFVMPVAWEFLLQYNYFTHLPEVLNAVEKTLYHLALGGVNDQLAGGFARYSVDKYWKVPHFEKMLYDNAQLISMYAHAFQVTQNIFYRYIFEKCYHFVHSELKADDGGYFSSLNADSEGEEGTFYVWTIQEVNALINSESDRLFFKEYYNLSMDGNWESGKNVLHATIDLKTFAKQKSVSEEILVNTIESVKEKLFLARNNRIRPSTDTKVITAWNSLMIQSSIDAFKATSNIKYLSNAIKEASFIYEQRWINGKLLRIKDGSTLIDGYLDDYAFTIQALISLHQVTLDSSWLAKANELIDIVLNHFTNELSPLFFYTDKDELFARKTEVMDNVIPSSNSVMAMNLLLLGSIEHHQNYIDKAEEMVMSISQNILAGNAYFANWAKVYQLVTEGVVTVTISGNEFESVLNELNSRYLPNVVYVKSDASSLEMQVCKNKSCFAPTQSIGEVIEQIMM